MRQLGGSRVAAALRAMAVALRGACALASTLRGIDSTLRGMAAAVRGICGVASTLRGIAAALRGRPLPCHEEFVGYIAV